MLTHTMLSGSWLSASLMSANRPIGSITVAIHRWGVGWLGFTEWLPSCMWLKRGQ